MNSAGPRSRRAFTLLLRVLVSVYWVTLIAVGCSRMMREGWDATLPVVHAWYLAALAFLFLWAPVAIVASIATARNEPKLRPLVRDPTPLRLR